MTVSVLEENQAGLTGSLRGNSRSGLRSLRVNVS